MKILNPIKEVKQIPTNEFLTEEELDEILQSLNKNTISTVEERLQCLGEYKNRV